MCTNTHTRTYTYTSIRIISYTHAILVSTMVVTFSVYLSVQMTLCHQFLYLSVPVCIQVAVKEVLANALASAMQNTQMISDFQKEMYLLCRLEHPNIVSCHGIVTRNDDGQLLMWCIMERLEIDLGKAIASGQLPLGANSSSVFVGLLVSLMSALAYLHCPVSPHTCLSSSMSFSILSFRVY